MVHDRAPAPGRLGRCGVGLGGTGEPGQRERPPVDLEDRPVRQQRLGHGERGAPFAAGPRPAADRIAGLGNRLHTPPGLAGARDEHRARRGDQPSVPGADHPHVNDARRRGHDLDALDRKAGLAAGLAGSGHRG
ncbi:MAG: hypothetical protein U0T02_00340 [Solirubrobacteraceae bacterium]